MFRRPGGSTAGFTGVLPIASREGIDFESRLWIQGESD